MNNRSTRTGPKGIVNKPKPAPKAAPKAAPKPAQAAPKPTSKDKEEKSFQENIQVIPETDFLKELNNDLGIGFFKLLVNNINNENDGNNENDENYKKLYAERSLIFLDFLSNFNIGTDNNPKYLLDINNNNISNDQKFENVEIINELGVLFETYDEMEVRTILEIYKKSMINQSHKSFFWFTKTCLTLKEKVREDNRKEDFIFGFDNIGSCESCQNKTIEVKVVRTAAADESSKVFYTCSKCRSRKIKFSEESAFMRKELQGL
jgi:DNA-directed RNA polymerase subunit M/transcription elongation factor TFIIS